MSALCCNYDFYFQANSPLAFDGSRYLLIECSLLAPLPSLGKYFSYIAEMATFIFYCVDNLSINSIF